ncbi:MAG: zinc ABC transporter substrate-binding protein [Myxococcales bacterium]|nr:MAG: zinc ABC transporter substrate-binding protein [Myxococcales bacterium]
MRTILLTLAALLAMTLPAQAKLRVVGTLPDFAAIAEELGGDRVETVSLIKGTQDPHFVDAKPSLILEVNRADLLIFIGMGLEEGWLPVLVTQSRNGHVQPGGPGYLDASTFVTPKEVVAKPDRAMGDIHGQGNPHYYTGPDEMLKVAEGIYTRLVQLDPEGKADYDARWKAFTDKYARKSVEWKTKLAALKGTNIVEYHKSWIYLIDWLEFSSVGALEPVPGVPPSPSHVSKLLMAVKNQNVRFVFQEVYQPTNLSRIFADKAGAKLLILPAMAGAEPGVKTIWDKFDRIVELLTQP